MTLNTLANKLPERGVMVNSQQEREAWVQLAFTPYVGPETFLLLIKHYGSAEMALRAPAAEIERIVRYKQAVRAWKGEDQSAQSAAEKAWRWAEQQACHLLLLSDSVFPTMLSEGMTPPPLLFLRGTLSCLQRPAVAIVGSRHATPQAQRIAQDFGRALSAKGIVVVSRMASGIDTAAHQGALQAEGGTIAVLGTGIDRVYPRSNHELAYSIAEKGLLVSEFPLGTRPLAANFPRRNRIIAGLSSATLVVEAALESGSLITARLASEMGREVMAIPGSIDNPHSKGCHKLIKEGAKLVECIEDIIVECSWPLGFEAKAQPMLTPIVNQRTAEDDVDKKHKLEKQVPTHTQPENQTEDLLTAMGFDPVHPDSLAESLERAAGDIYAELLELELAGAVAIVPGGRYQRILR